MPDAADPKNADFRRGWDAALRAVRDWHAAKAKQTLVLAKRSRFPKTLEREADMHEKAAEMIPTLSPDDV